MKVKEVELIDNDVYFIEILDDLLVINDNYQGILIFDSEFRQVGQIKLIEGLSIYTSYKKDKELLLFCADNNCFIYVNVELNYQKIIDLSEFDYWIFSTLYDWDKKNIILSDYQNHFMKINLNTGCLTINNVHNAESQAIRDDYNKLKKFKIIKNDGFEKKAFVELYDKKVGLVDYKQDLNIIKEFEQGKYHDFELANDYIVKIGENKVEILIDSEVEIFYPSEKYYFLRGKFMYKDNKTYLFLLSGDKTNSCHIKIEKYEL